MGSRHPKTLTNDPDWPKKTDAERYFYSNWSRDWGWKCCTINIPKSMIIRTPTPDTVVYTMMMLVIGVLLVDDGNGSYQVHPWLSCFFLGITVLALTGMFHHYDYDVEDLVNLLIVTVNLSLIMNFTKWLQLRLMLYDDSQGFPSPSAPAKLRRETSARISAINYLWRFRTCRWASRAM